MGCHWHSVLITGHDMKHVMVELGGIEPPSANPLQIDLHT